VGGERVRQPRRGDANPHEVTAGGQSVAPDPLAEPSARQLEIQKTSYLLPKGARLIITGRQSQAPVAERVTSIALPPATAEAAMSPQRSGISLTASGLITALSVSLAPAIADPAFVSPQQSYEQCLRDGFSHEACWDKQTLPNRVRVVST
jgi:hypothetical protein